MQNANIFVKNIHFFATLMWVLDVVVEEKVTTMAVFILLT
jgi:hypothetical protein